ncbi:hypothetical protein ACHAXM_007871 [Skeletonema potamos]
MKILFASTFMALFAAAPGAAGSSSIRGVVDTYDSQDFESSSSFDTYLQATSPAGDAEMMDSEAEDEIINNNNNNNNNNIFVTLGNRNNREDNCGGIGWLTCTRRSPHDCTWICNTREHAGDHDCCVSAYDPRSIQYKNPSNSNNRDNDCKGIGWGDCSRFSPHKCKWICDDRQTAGDHDCCVSN